MTDARYPDRWLNDRRIVRLSDRAHRMLVTSLTWSVSNRTDGLIAHDDLPLLPCGDGDVAGDLVKAGLWEVTPEGWRIIDFDETQTTRQELAAADAARRKARDKKRRQRASAPRVSRGTSPGTSQARQG
jgi:hypothetical protein